MILFQDVALARSRRIGREPQRGLTVKSFLRAFTFWELWAVASKTPSNYHQIVNKV